MTSIRELIKYKDKIVIGKVQVFKLMKLNKLEEVVLASNSNFNQEVERLSKLSKIKFSVSRHTNKELGALFKKPFSINILGLKK